MLTNSTEIIRSVASQIKHHQVAIGKEIVAHPNPDIVEFKTDPILLKRILTNMVKNALEASSEEQKVTIGCQHKGASVEFWVKNDDMIPKNIQLQIFQRSFSTKGTSRGLGTYSMKLIGEKYLLGKVSFESKENEGTKFMINLPISLD